MFLYLLHNSTLIKKQNTVDKHISTLIYGTLIYIILHSVIYASDDNKFMVSFRKYFWIIVILDCISISFTYIAKENGSVCFSRDIEFKIPDNKPKKKFNRNIAVPIQRETNKPIIETKETYNNTKPEIPIVKIKLEETIPTKKKEDAPTNLVKKEVIEELNIDNISKIEDNSSDLDSELGSDIDLDFFEKSLREEYNVDA